MQLKESIIFIIFKATLANGFWEGINFTQGANRQYEYHFNNTKILKQTKQTVYLFQATRI